LGDDLNPVNLLELIAELFTSELLIVDDDYAQRGTHAVICSGAISSGTSMRALVPRPGSLSSVN